MNGPSLLQLPIQMEPRRYRHFLIHLMAVFHDKPSVPVFALTLITTNSRLMKCNPSVTSWIILVKP